MCPSRVFVFAAAAALLAASATLAKNLVLAIQGANNSADFTSVDASRCVTTTVHIESGEEVIRDPSADPPNVSTVGAYVVITQADSCSNVTSAWQGFSEDVRYEFDRQLTQATLVGTMQACDPDTGANCVAFTINLVWNGYGSDAPVKAHYRTVSGCFILITHIKADLRSATATGSISDGTTNYTPNPSDSAFFAWATTRQVTVHRRQRDE